MSNTFDVNAAFDESPRGDDCRNTKNGFEVDFVLRHVLGEPVWVRASEASEKNPHYCTTICSDIDKYFDIPRGTTKFTLNVSRVKVKDAYKIIGPVSYDHIYIVDTGEPVQVGDNLADLLYEERVMRFWIWIDYKETP